MSRSLDFRKQSLSPDMHFSVLSILYWKQVNWIKRHRRVQTLVKKSGSWLRERLWLEMVVVFLSGPRPCQAFFTFVRGLGGRPGRGLQSPQGKESEEKRAALEKEQREERPFSWCDFPADFCRTCLARLWPLALSQLTLSFSWCLSDHDAFVNVSGRLWEQQTPVYEVSLPVDMRVKGKFCLSCFCQCLCLSVFSCHDRSQHWSVRCAAAKDNSSSLTGHPLKLWGESKDTTVFLSFALEIEGGGGRKDGRFCLYLSLYVPECLSSCQNRSPHSRVSLCGSEWNQSSHTG